MCDGSMSVSLFHNSNASSSRGTPLDEGTNVWPCFLTKKSMNCWRISLDVDMETSSQKNWPQMNTDKHRSKTQRVAQAAGSLDCLSLLFFLSVFICVHL